MGKNKLNVLLGVTDHLRSNYKNMVSNYTSFFKDKQGSFKGEKKTYDVRDGVIDDPKKKGLILVVTTVKEKFDYYVDHSEKFINALFNQEKTNSSGTAVAHLVVDGDNWGEFTSLELLRLKSLLESSDLGNFGDMLKNIPVRSDAKVWKESDSADYEGREIFQSKLLEGVTKTTVKEPYVLVDPNLVGRELPVNYTAPIVQRDNVMELGDYTVQEFSGEWSQREKALCLSRRATLLVAITEALKVANDCEVVASDLTAKRIFDYLFYNK